MNNFLKELETKKLNNIEKVYELLDEVLVTASTHFEKDVTYNTNHGIFVIDNVIPGHLMTIGINHNDANINVRVMTRETETIVATCVFGVNDTFEEHHTRYHGKDIISSFFTKIGDILSSNEADVNDEDEDTVDQTDSEDSSNDIVTSDETNAEITNTTVNVPE
jgi:hypothetical protein